MRSGTPAGRRCGWIRPPIEARVALDHAADDADGFHAAKLATARFYFSELLPETDALARVVRAGAGPLMALDAAGF